MGYPHVWALKKKKQALRSWIPAKTWRYAKGMDTRSYKPGERVPASGIYRVEHDPHRLMHPATLVANTKFPICRQCGRSVRFYLVRTVATAQVLPFRSNSLLEEYSSGGPELMRVG